MPDTPIDHERWLRIKALFTGALEQPSDNLDRWLDAECGDDADLRREVESLVASHHSDPGFLQAPALALPGAAHAVSERVGPSLGIAMIGRRLGPYRLVAEIGRGGMGVVYLAERDDEAFHRQVAIKMVYGGALHPSLVDRLEAERRIIARLEHPNIARLLDAGTDETGAPFAVMEYVEGTPIDRYVTDHHLTVAQRLELFCTVCDAVQYSHERLVVHRDIKPGNVLVTGDGVPKLLDFGIAKLLDPSSATTEQTREDLRALTPESASPEQVRGDPITVATDVYSLGVLLFRLLTGASPYGSHARAAAEMSRAICEEEPPRPSEAVADGMASRSAREIASRRRELAGDLDLITKKALSKEPERRYASVDRLARDIRRHRDGEPVEAVPDSRVYRARKFVGRHRVGVALSVVIALTIGAGLSATLVAAHAARLERERAERRFNDVRALAGSMIFEVHDAIEPLPGSTAARELLVRRALEYLDRLASEPAADFSLQRELASAYSRIAEVQGDIAQSNLGRQKAALESSRKALDIRERLARAEPSNRDAERDLAETERSVGVMFSQVGENQHALEHIRAAVSIGERLVRERPGDPAFEPVLARAYMAWSDALVPLSDWPQALSLVRKALPLFKHAAEAKPEQAKAQRSLALACKRIGALEAKVKDYPKALEAYQEALGIDQARLVREPENPEARMDVSLDVSDVGFILYRSGDLRGALSQFERVRAIRKDLAHADPNDTRAALLLASAMSRVGSVRWALGEHEAAQSAHHEALALYDMLAAKMPTDVSLQRQRADELAGIAINYTQMSGSGCRRARPFLLKALDSYERLAATAPAPPETSTHVSDVKAALARCGAGR